MATIKERDVIRSTCDTLTALTGITETDRLIVLAINDKSRGYGVLLDWNERLYQGWQKIFESTHPNCLQISKKYFRVPIGILNSKIRSFGLP
jgi:hypothetical protein